MKQTRPDDSNGITPEISVVVLCYRAGQGVYFISDQVKQVLESITNNWEMILVGNYDVDCHDKTPEIVRGIADKDSRIKSVTHEKQGRMGWDAVTGLKAATGETISFIDGDGQMPVEDIKSVYDTLINDSLDIVLTYRVDRMDGRQRWFMSRVYNIIFNLMFPGYIVRDVNSKPKIFTRRFFEQLQLNSTDWFLDAEIIIQARRNRSRLGEVPTVFRASADRKSFVNVKAVFEFMKNLALARIREWRNHS